MADAFTGTSALDSDTTAYEQLAYWDFEAQLFFDTVADVKPSNESHVGAAVTFFIHDHLAVATTALNEITDPEVVALSDNTVTLTLAEYGNVVANTKKLRGTSFFDIDGLAARAVGYNAGKSLDTLARTPLLAGTNVRYSGDAGARANITTGDQLTANDVRVVRTYFANNDVPPLIGPMYKAYIAPDVSFDLRTETGDANWRDPHVYAGMGGPTEAIKNGSIGAFEGFDFSETSRLSQAEIPAATWADAGAANVDVYPTIFVGREALAKTWSKPESGPMPRVVIGPETDRLRRLHTLGWYWMGAYGRFREESLYRVESMSTIGSNA